MTQMKAVASITVSHDGEVFHYQVAKWIKRNVDELEFVDINGATVTLYIHRAFVEIQIFYPPRIKRPADAGASRRADISYGDISYGDISYNRS